MELQILKKMKRSIKIYLFAFIALLGFVGCEDELDLDLPDTAQLVVVEGNITEGQPPLVYMTRTLPAIGEIRFSEIDSFFVGGAEITVSNGTETMVLEEYNLDSIGIFYYVGQTDFITGNFFVGEAGQYNDLEINLDNRLITGRTKIPNSNPLDSIYYDFRSVGGVDSLARIFVGVTDADTIGNFYRFFTQRNEEPEYPITGSVFDDLLINGDSFPAFVERGQNPNEEFDFNTFGYFRHNDSVTVRISSIDKAHYDYWNTFEANAQGGGPFSGITVVDSNIEGESAIGVWGGYGVQTISTRVIYPSED